LRKQQQLVGRKGQGEAHYSDGWCPWASL